VLCMTVEHIDMHTHEQFFKVSVGLGLDFVYLLCLAFCVFFWFNLHCFVLVLFAFVVPGLIPLVLAKRLAGKNVSKMTYFV